MPIFIYKVISENGKIREGNLVASDAKEATLKLELKKNKIIELKENTTLSTQSFGKAKVPDNHVEKTQESGNPPVKRIVYDAHATSMVPRQRSRIESEKSSKSTLFTLPHKFFAAYRAFIAKYQISTYDILICTRQLQQMISAGLSTVKAITVLWENQSNEVLRKVLNEINIDIHRGMSLSSALSRFPHIFSPTYLAMIRIGEATGNLDESLKNISYLLEREHKMKSKISASLTYPGFIFTIAVIIMVVVIFYFVPVFINVFEQLHLSLPLPTRILLFFVKTLKRLEVVCLLVASTIICGVSFKFFSKNISFRIVVDEIKLSIPILGETILLISLGSILNNMAIMLRSGVPLLRTMSIIIASTTLTPLKGALQILEDDLKRGSNFTCARLNPRYFSLLFKSFVAAGEESGSLPSMLESLAGMYENCISARLDTIVSLMEPVLLTLVSVVIGFILISVFLPLYGVLNSLG